MKNIHIKLEYGEAIDAKKELLSSEVNLLEFLKRFKDYKNERNRELILKSNFKRELASLKSEVTRLEETLPKEEGEEIKIIHKRMKIKHKEAEKKTHRDIEMQLQDIKEKLASLDQPMG